MGFMKSKAPIHRLQAAKPKAGEVDLVVGTRLRRRRHELGMSQKQLADALGIAQQQLQKYETGQNRISAVRLFEAAQILGMPVAWFYERLDDPEAEERLQDMAAAADDEPGRKLSDIEILTLLKDYANDPLGRKKLLEMMRTLFDPPTS